MIETGTPDLTEVLEHVIDTASRDIRVSIPGVVVSADVQNGRVSVQPAVQEADAETRDPIILDVPIVWPRCGKVRISFPLEAGDKVLLIFCDRSLDAWFSGGGDSVDNYDPRKHDITDAFAIPMDITGIPSDRVTDFSIDYEDGELRIDSSGNITVHGVTEIKLGHTATESILKGTTVISSFAAIVSAIATAYTAWELIDPPTTTSNGAFISALAAAWAALGGTMTGWPSLKSKTE